MMQRKSMQRWADSRNQLLPICRTPGSLSAEPNRPAAWRQPEGFANADAPSWQLGKGRESGPFRRLAM